MSPRCCCYRRAGVVDLLKMCKELARLTARARGAVSQFRTEMKGFADCVVLRAVKCCNQDNPNLTPR